MSTTACAFAVVLERIGRQTLAELEGMPEALLNQPLDLPETNTLYALATHLVGAGEYWALVLVGKRDIARDRPAEFRASGTLSDLVARYERWIAELHPALDPVPDVALDEIAAVPAAYQWQGDVALTLRDCLLHAVEHSALHLGHIQLTAQLLRNGVVGGGD
ncbi:MAG TPA: DinB family protein [Ktedonobacterales bacterium]|jgi:uncharacterized damage-inducible protein DinB|nr:DinB family protein [Ktedonobacterales bacterium]